MNLSIKGIITLAIGLVVFFTLLPMIMTNLTSTNATEAGLTGVAATVWGFLGLAAAAGVLYFVFRTFGGGGN